MLALNRAEKQPPVGVVINVAIESKSNLKGVVDAKSPGSLSEELVHQIGERGMFLKEEEEREVGHLL
jgi:hypothetical protein